MDTELLVDLPEIEVEELDIEYLTDSDYDSDPADCVIIHWER